MRGLIRKTKKAAMPLFLWALHYNWPRNKRRGPVGLRFANPTYFYWPLLATTKAGHFPLPVLAGLCSSRTYPGVVYIRWVTGLQLSESLTLTGKQLLIPGNVH